MIKKFVAIFISIILIFNMIVFAMGKVNILFFWYTLFLSLIVVYFYYPKKKN